MPLVLFRLFGVCLHACQQFRFAGTFAIGCFVGAVGIVFSVARLAFVPRGHVRFIVVHGVGPFLSVHVTNDAYVAIPQGISV